MNPSSSTGTPDVPPTASCITCAYSLVGLPFSDQCPECNTPVAESLRGALLQFAGREHLVTLSKGLSFVLDGILIMVITLVVATAGVVVAVAGHVKPQTILLLSAMVIAVVSFVMLRGYWMFTELDPGAANLQEQKPARKLVRVCLLVQAGSTTLGLVVLLTTVIAQPPSASNLWRAFDTMLATVLIIAIGIGVIAWVVRSFAVLVYLRVLARRVPDGYIEKRAEAFLWLLPVVAILGYFVLGLGPTIALVMYWNLLDRLRKHIKSILTVGTPAELGQMVAGK